MQERLETRMFVASRCICLSSRETQYTHKHPLGLKLTQSSPLLMVESAMTTLSLRKMSHPSVFFAAFFDVEVAEIVMFLKVTSVASFTYRVL